MASAPTEPAQEKHSNLIPWKPGQSGNPKGRERGSRNKLGEDFIERLHAHWQENGDVAIEEVFENDKVAYLKVIASVIPKEVIHSPAGGLEDLEYDELRRLFIELALRSVGLEPSGLGDGAETLPPPMSDEPPLALSSRSGPEGLR